jgi:hypothetical protein
MLLIPDTRLDPINVPEPAGIPVEMPFFVRRVSRDGIVRLVTTVTF